MRSPSGGNLPDRRHAFAVLAIAVFLAGGCGPKGRQRGAAPAREPAVVVFSNRSMYEAALYMVPRGGTQLRIGTVQPGRTDTLTIRATSVPAGGSLTLVARLLASRRTPSTGALTLQGGDWISVTLTPDANMLNVLPVP
jgi:hypothetical protein